MTVSTLEVSSQVSHLLRSVPRCSRAQETFQGSHSHPLSSLNCPASTLSVIIVFVTYIHTQADSGKWLVDLLKFFLHCLTHQVVLDCWLVDSDWWCTYLLCFVQFQLHQALCWLTLWKCSLLNYLLRCATKHYGLAVFELEVRITWLLYLARRLFQLLYRRCVDANSNWLGKSVFEYVFNL